MPFEGEAGSVGGGARESEEGGGAVGAASAERADSNRR